MSPQKPSASPPRRLGRGLGSLMASSVPVEIELPRDHARTSRNTTEIPAQGAGESSDNSEHMSDAEIEATDGIRYLPLDQIVPNPRQPRTAFDPASLQALADSIRQAGVMQPIMVRPRSSTTVQGQTPPATGFELIAGERRWRAAALAGLKSIPAVVRAVDDRTAAELALIENLQREDLNTVERADAFQRLIREFGMSQQALAERVGLDRSSVANILRIKELDERIQAELASGRLSLSHAKALLMVEDTAARLSLAVRCVRQSWSVRTLEIEARRAASVGAVSGKPALAPAAEPIRLRAQTQLDAISRALAAQFGTRVRVRAGRRKGSGRIVIEFFSLDQFEELMRRMNVRLD